MPDGNGFVINGRKWLITGAEGAAFAIIMARTGDGPGDCTMFLTELPNPAFKISRVLGTMDSSFMGGHAVIDIENLRVTGDDILGEVGKGFQYAQVRLAPARLTHCMRWLGSAIRAHDIATEYARERKSFGKPLGDHQGVSFMLADNAHRHPHRRGSRSGTRAWLLDQGDRASTASSMAKVICSEAIFRVVDRSLQILGGMGVTSDTVVERIFRDVRAFRIYDGPSEVHRHSSAAASSRASARKRRSRRSRSSAYFFPATAASPPPCRPASPVFRRSRQRPARASLRLKPAKGPVATCCRSPACTPREDPRA